jgi:hypothetical protein
MNKAETQKRWLEAFRKLDEEAEGMKQSMWAPFGLLNIYDGLTDDEKAYVHLMLDEWLRSDDGGMRYDAKFIISERRVRLMKSAVESAIAEFSGRPGPIARDYVKDLRRIASDLE